MVKISRIGLPPKFIGEKRAAFRPILSIKSHQPNGNRILLAKNGQHLALFYLQSLSNGVATKNLMGNISGPCCIQNVSSISMKLPQKFLAKNRQNLTSRIALQNDWQKMGSIPPCFIHKNKISSVKQLKKYWRKKGSISPQLKLQNLISRF